ncbi:uncharacterized protein LOC110693110 [Chenopodium quinoa]|uniref:uncharacterized protein LOC110693110 n=1 Tax=Chenopodium quinoa TaxID=63459 RepID=UPI000B76C05E|nr:uncharacterized protein LOC110693110 [Chenopodium quinoa]
MLLHCPKAASNWSLSVLRLDPNEVVASCLRSWCASMSEKIKDPHWWDLFWCLAWGVWLQRNAWVFEKKSRYVIDIIHKAVGLVGEYEEAMKVASVSKPSQMLNSAWKAPPRDMYKPNSDANLGVNQQLGVGGVLRDAEGVVLLAFCSKVKGNFEVEVGEAIALWQSLLTALEAGFRNMVLETDNLKLFHHMKKGIIMLSAFGNVVSDILRLASQCFSCSFSFVRRKGKCVAHSLAKLSSTFSDYRVWLEEYLLKFMGRFVMTLNLC